jgi:hypothetical protein
MRFLLFILFYSQIKIKCVFVLRDKKKNERRNEKKKKEKKKRKTQLANLKRE